MRYALKGKRPGFEILPGDDLKRCPDGYTEVRLGGECVGIYMTALLIDEEPGRASMR